MIILLSTHQCSYDATNFCLLSVHLAVLRRWVFAIASSEVSILETSLTILQYLDQKLVKLSPRFPSASNSGADFSTREEHVVKSAQKRAVEGHKAGEIRRRPIEPAGLRAPVLVYLCKTG